MISSVLILFQKKIKSFCCANGITHHGNSVFFVKNDILFSFSLKKVCRSYSIDFGLAPLCMGITDVMQGEDFNTSGLTRRTYPLDEVTPSADELWWYVQNEILPFFESCKDAASALLSLLTLKKRMEENRLAYLLCMNAQDMAIPFSERFYLNDTVFYLAMKALDYSSMGISLNYQEQHETEKLSIFQNDYQRYSREENGEMMQYCVDAIQTQKEKCEIINQYKRQIDLRNDSFFLQKIRQEENKSFIFLKENKVVVLPGAWCF